jgi:hypothetical protein
MSAALVSYGSAVAAAAGLLNAALAELHAAGVTGGAQAVAAQSSGLRNGMSAGDLAAQWVALPREQGAAIAA